MTKTNIIANAFNDLEDAAKKIAEEQNLSLDLLPKLIAASICVGSAVQISDRQNCLTRILSDKVSAEEFAKFFSAFSEESDRILLGLYNASWSDEFNQ